MTLAQTITEPTLDLPGIAHGFFTRQGGVSGGMYESLNCGLGSSDIRGNVIENRSRVARSFGLEGDGLLTVHQIHGADVVTVTAPFSTDPPRADGLVTNTPGLALGVLTADCAPLLFADPEAGVIGAAHAGWRGALSGIGDATVAAMEALGAKRAAIRVVVGPSISVTHYEVGPEFAASFVDADPVNTRFFRGAARPGHTMFDLAGYLVARLSGLGIGSVETTGHCTYADPGRFFSYRRATHGGEPDYGRQISAICVI